MKIRDIAKAGLKGRKKDTLLITLVITLAFVFIVTSTIFQSSTEKTKLEQAFDLYGEWHGAYLGANEEILNQLKNEKDIEKLGTSLIVGESDTCGIVGTFNEDLLDMSRFKLYKGTYPTKDNEIMVELNQMSKMGLDLEVGQKVQVAITIPKYIDVVENFIKRSEELRAEGARPQSAYDEPRAEFYTFFQEYMKILYLDEKVANQEEKLRQLEENYKKFEGLSSKFHAPLFPQEILEMYEYQIAEFREILDIKPENEEEEAAKWGRLYRYENSLENFIYRVLYLNKPIKSYKYHEVPFENIEDVVVVISNSYIHYYRDGEFVSPEIIREKGVLTEQNITLKREFIVSGILEGYSDKWDIGNHKVANAFITEEGGKSFTNAFYNNTIEDFSDHKMDYNVFLTSDSMKDKLYDNLFSKYPDIDKYSKVLYDTTYVEYHLAPGYLGEDRETIIKGLEEEKQWNEQNQWNVERKDETGKDSSIEGIWGTGEEMEVNNSNFRKNTFAFADVKGTTESVLSLTIIGVIFVATALAIFQIFLTQMKRRSRKLVLLKSIGATKGQIIKIILYEGVYFLRNSLFIGVPLGLISSVSLIFGMNKFAGRNLRFFIEPSLLLLGIFAGILSLFVGMIVPMIYAIRIPLVGTLSKPPKHKKKKYYAGMEVEPMSFSRINWEYLKLNKGKTLISFGISFITITILLSTTLLCYSSFNDYKTTVLENSRPDYAMEAIYGEATRQLNIQKEELLAIDGVKYTETYRAGKQLYLWYEGIENNKLLSDFDRLLPLELRKNYFSRYNANLQELDLEPYITDAFLTKIYGIFPDGELFSKYNKAISDGSVDPKKFANGEEVILMMPMYTSGNKAVDKEFSKQEVLDSTNEDNRMNYLFEKSGLYKLSYDERFSEIYRRQDFIKPGDTIYLSSDLEEVSDSSFDSQFQTKKVKVGGIIHYLPQGGGWPFSNSKANYVVISSMKGMGNIYPLAAGGLKKDQLEYMRDAIEVLYPTRYGRTLWYINTDSINRDIVLDSKLLAYAHNNNYTIYNYKEGNAKLYQEGFNNALIIGLLGITAAAIACIILYNIIASRMEQDKNRIGILQALGVTKGQFGRNYILEGLANGIVALLLVNGLLIIVLFLTSIGGGVNMTLTQRINDVFIYRLWLYPWVVHGLLCLVFLLVTILIYYLPSKKIIRNSPVENIRSLSR